MVLLQPDVINKEKAILLRQQGFSIRDIVKKLNKSISTISLWVKDVELTKEQKAYLESKNPAKNFQLYGNKRAVDKIKITYLERRKRYQEEGRSLCRELLAKRDVDFFVGIALYWAEGYKSKNKNAVRFCNTDMSMMKLFVNFLKKYFNVKDEEILISVYYWATEDIEEKKIEKHWVDILELKESNLRKSYIENKRKVTGKRKNKHTYGVCNLTVHRTDVIQKIYGAIQEYTGVNKSEWSL